MISSALDVSASVSDAVQEYRQHGDIAALLDRMKALSIAADPETLIAATTPYHDLPEVVIPAYERVVTARPEDAQAMVVLANAYWLTGRSALEETIANLKKWTLEDHVGPSYGLTTGYAFDRTIVRLSDWLLGALFV